MPRLLRGVARTAVIAGTATHVSNNVSRRQGERWAAKEAAQAPPPPQQVYAEPAPQPPASDRMDELAKLGELKAQGILTDEEFAQEKARILAS